MERITLGCTSRTHIILINDSDEHGVRHEPSRQVRIGNATLHNADWHYGSGVLLTTFVCVTTTHRLHRETLEMQWPSPTERTTEANLTPSMRSDVVIEVKLIFRIDTTQP